MSKKTIIGILIVVFVLIILPIAWYYWQNNGGNQGIDDLIPPNKEIDAAINKNTQKVEATNTEMNIYVNKKYGYSIEYPKTWWYAWLGNDDGAMADVYWFVSDKTDMELKDGGLPAGAKAEIIVQNLQELKDIDSSMSKIDTIEKYVEWQNSYQGSFDADMQGVCQVENINLNRVDAIKKVCDNPIDVNFGKIIKIQLLSPDGNYVFLIQYIGSEPNYSSNKNKFDNIYQSFKLL